MPTAMALKIVANRSARSRRPFPFPGTIAIALKQSSPIENYFIKVSRILGNTAYSLNIVYDTAGNTGATARLLSDADGAFGRHDVAEGVSTSDTI